MSPRVSVVIPCYNQAEYLTEAVESVVGQTYSDWEIVIVNDGSTDATPQVARELMLRFSNRRLRCIEQSNLGVGTARNTAIAASAGDYILPLDADDRLHADFLRLTVEVLDAFPQVSIAYTDQQHFGERNEVLPLKEYDFRLMLIVNLFAVTALYRRCVWEDVGGYDPTIIAYQDWDFWISAGAKGHVGKRVPHPLLHYRVGKSSLSTWAQPRHAELTARIVLKHATLYGTDDVQLARKLLGLYPAQDKSRVVAVLSACNDADVIHHVIGDLIANGVEVYLLDHGSTDATVLEASRWLGQGLLYIERFKSARWDGRRRMEELAAEIGASRYLQVDAMSSLRAPGPSGEPDMQA